MLSNQYQIVEDEFKVGFRTQHVWSWSMATAFFFGEVGAGLYFVSAFFNFVIGMVVGLLLVAVGKSTGHLMHLGRPDRAWRAITKIRTSWVSRGLFSIMVFTSFGTLHIADVFYKWLPGPLSMIVAAIAGAACLVIMVYQGFAMSHSSSVTLWSTGLMPVMSLTYALLGGVMMTLVLGYNSIFAQQPANLHLLQVVAIGLVLYGLVMIVSMLHGAWFGSEGGQESVEMLIHKDLSQWFIPLVILVGFMGTGLFMLFGPTTFGAMLVVAAAELAGYYAFRILIFKAATYEPIMSFAPHFKR